MCENNFVFGSIIYSKLAISYSIYKFHKNIQVPFVLLNI